MLITSDITDKFGNLAKKVNFLMHFFQKIIQKDCYLFLIFLELLVK